MKIYLVFLIFGLLCLNLHAQTDYTGIYRYSFPLDKSISTSEPSPDDGGPSGELILAKMEADQYTFWLNISRGWPSYNMGFITGRFDIRNGKARFSQADSYGEGTCILNFTFKPTLIEIVSDGNEHCGFGHAVYADGKFKKSQKMLTNEYLFATMEGMGTVREIKSVKSVVYKDSNLQIPTKQYFIKKDKVYTSETSEKGIRFIYIAKGQKFVYGWLNKEDL